MKRWNTHNISLLMPPFSGRDNHHSEAPVWQDDAVWTTHSNDQRLCDSRRKYTRGLRLVWCMKFLFNLRWFEKIWIPGYLITRLNFVSNNFFYRNIIHFFRLQQTTCCLLVLCLRQRHSEYPNYFGQKLKKANETHRTTHVSLKGVQMKCQIFDMNLNSCSFF